MNVFRISQNTYKFSARSSSEKIVLQLKHTLTCTFFQQYVFLYSPLKEQTMWNSYKEKLQKIPYETSTVKWNKTLWQRHPQKRNSCFILEWAYGNKYIKQLKHLLGHGRVDRCTTFDTGRWSFVPWILTQLWRPPVLAQIIGMASNPSRFDFFVWQMVKASPLQDDLIFFKVCTRQNNFLDVSYIISTFMQTTWGSAVQETFFWQRTGIRHDYVVVSIFVSADPCKSWPVMSVGM